jgi:hypothetical protein
MIMDNTDNMSGENPGVLIKVDGRLVPCDKYIASLRTNIELALKWAEEERLKNDALREVVCKMMDALPYDDLLAYMEEREEYEERRQEEEA